MTPQPLALIALRAKEQVLARSRAILTANLALLDANGKATRVGFRMEGDKKVRFAKTTGDVI